MTYDIQLLPGLDSVPDGHWELPVPDGLYDVRIEPMDDFPLPGYGVSYPGWVGYLLGMLDFEEESWDVDREGAIETSPGHATPIRVHPGEEVTDVDFVTNRSTVVGNYGDWNTALYPDAPPGSYYAVRIPGEQVLEAAGGEPFAIQSADFFTAVLDHSVVVRFAAAMLTTGHALADGTAEVDLDEPLAVIRPFLAQEYDFAPFDLPDSVGLGRSVENGIRRGEIDSLFLVLQVPTEAPFPGFNGLAPIIGVDGPYPYPGYNDVPIYGLSYRSLDGEVWVQDGWNYMFRLELSAVPEHGFLSPAAGDPAR